MSYAGQARLNFTLELGAVTQSVDVTVTQDSILRDSSASVGDVLSQEKIQNLPMVGNNVLDLLNTLPGMRMSPAGDQFNTINGLGMNTVNTTRDGLSTVDTRFYPEFWGTRTFSTTTINPDLVGEIRLIVSPVDAELGRGSAQVQISTRSGTNRYTGSASWNVRNSALDANTWTNNHTAYTDPISGALYNSTPRNWSNLHEYSIAYGGPIKIPGVYDGLNKTFFYALWDQNIRNTRDSVNVNVLTDTARQGIYRYWEGYNPVGWNPAQGIANPVYPLQATNASLIAVDQRGNAVRPVAAPTSPTNNPSAPGFIPYSGGLVCFSVFGTSRLDSSGNMVPFTANDCPGGTARIPTGRNVWDNFRPTFDSSGLIKKLLESTPRANYFGAGDGLNTAQLRWVRGRSGDQNTLNGVATTIAGAANVGSSAFVNRKQLNLKIDHNFNTSHKVAVSYTLQRDDNADNCGNYPGSLCGGTFRRPHTLTSNLTSTLGSRMVNEARFGLNYTKNYTYAPWVSPIPEVAEAARQYMLPAGTSGRDPNYTYLALVQTALGNISPAAGVINTGSAQVYAENPLFNWADTLSWSRGKHAFKFGADWRLPRTTGNGSAVPDGRITLGNASATATPSPFGVVANFNTATDPVGYLPGLLNAAPGGATAGRTNATNLLYYLNGSVAGVTQEYWITSSRNQTEGYWDDISTQDQRLRKQVNQEWALFVKDDYKVTNRLTLNLGVRWEYYSSPFIAGGFTTTMDGYGWGAFGATRAAQTTLEQFNADPFSILYKPGNLFLTGYGSSTSNPLSCQKGVQQHALLPVSTCDPSALSVIKFVGPDSPNPNVNAMPENWYNIGPAIGFAYSLPWFGEGKTTIRGGYQQTFGAAGTNRSAGIGGVEGIIANAPGATTQGTLAVNLTNSLYQNILQTRAINLSDVKSLVPMRPNQLTPGTPVYVYGRSFSPQVYDPNLQTPYTQNITLSVIRQINRKFTVDVRYTGTLGRKQLGNINTNNNNIYTNPELFQALTDARAGTCTASSAAYKSSYTDKGINPCNVNGDPVLLDQLLAGLNLNANVTGPSGQGTFGFVGTVNTAGIYQSGAQHLRRNATFQDNLAFGNFDGVADSLIALAPTAAQGRQAAPLAPGTGSALGGISLIGMRNGCDRIANGYSVVQQTTPGGSQVANSGSAIPLRCFPEDWLISNPQFNTVTYNTNLGRTNYHALQAELTARPVPGINIQSTWIWAKSMFLPTTGYIDPANRNLNFTLQNINEHSLRMNGTIELPIGPNKLLFGNSSGWAARLIERWQTSFIFNAASGTPTTFNPGISHFYAASGYDIASTNWVIPKAKVEWIEGTTGGTMYPGNRYLGDVDPQCLDSKVVTFGDRMGTSLSGYGTDGAIGSTGAVCDISALFARNADGTKGELLLKYPMPGQVGNLGRGNIYYFGQWSLDMNASKSFRLSESKSIQIRMDATNVLNHATPNQPTLSAGNLGAINGKGNQTRQFQGQLRLQF